MPIKGKARLKHTFAYLDKHISQLQDDYLSAFAGLTNRVVAGLGRRRAKRSVKNGAMSGFVAHWFNWYLIIKDRLLELHNGELRHLEHFQRDPLPFRNNFDLRSERYFKGGTKQYSGT